MNWNNSVKDNPNLKLYTTGGRVDLVYVFGMLLEEINDIKSILPEKYNEEKILELVRKYVAEYSSIVERIKSIIDCVTVASDSFLGGMIAVTIVTAGNPVAVGAVLFTTTLSIAAHTVKLLCDPLYYRFQMLKEVKTLDEAACILTKTIDEYLVPFEPFIREFANNYVGEDVYSFAGDLFSEISSQTAEGYNNNAGELVELYTYIDLKIGLNGTLNYSNRTFDLAKKNINSVGIPHNLEARDDDLIAYIARNITLVKPTTIYTTSNEPDLTLRIHNLEYQEYIDKEGNKIKIYPEVLDISQTLDGFPVTAIGDKAFEDSENLQKLILPNTLQEVGLNIFKGCNQLKYVQQEPLETYSYVELPKNENGQSITVEDNVIYSGKETKIIAVAPIRYKQAEEKEEIITNFYIPITVKKIAPYAFYGTSIKSFSGGENLQKIDKHAFLETPWFDSRKGFAIIGKWIVGYGGKKTEFAASDFPVGVMYIADGAFTRYENYAPIITSMTFGANIKSIGTEVFKDCVDLEKVNFSLSQIKSVAEYAFSGCVNLNEIKLNNITEVIESGAFDRCRSITEFELSPSMQAIGSNAFYGCNNLNKVIVRSLYPISLGPDAFSGCSSNLKI